MTLEKNVALELGETINFHNIQVKFYSLKHEIFEADAEDESIPE